MEKRAVPQYPIADLIARRWSPRAFDESHARILFALTPSNQAWAKNAPVLICAVASKVWTGKSVQNEWAEQDLGISLGYMLLQATDQGLFSHPMGGFSRDKILESFVLAPELRPMTVIAVGYYGDTGTLEDYQQIREKSARERVPLSEFVLNKF